MELSPLAVELGLGAVARVREPARVFQAGGEHREDKGHGDSSIVTTTPSLGPAGTSKRPLATVDGLADDEAP